MGSATKVSFAPVEWCAEAESHLLSIEGVTNAACDYYQEATNQGEKNLWGVFVDEQRVGSIIWHTGLDLGRKFLMVDEMAANAISGLQLASEADEFISHIGGVVKADIVRFWTRRTGLVQLMQNHWETQYVMERTL